MFCFVLKLLALSAFTTSQIFLCPRFRGDTFLAWWRVQKNSCPTANPRASSDVPHQWKRGQIPVYILTDTNYSHVCIANCKLANCKFVGINFSANS